MKSAIVVLFNDELTERKENELMFAITKSFAKIIESDKLDVRMFTADDIAKAVLCLANIETQLNKSQQDELHQEVPNMTPEDHAVIYIGTLFKEYLEEGDLNKFARALFEKDFIINKNPSIEDPNRQFRNAIYLLSKDTIRVSKKLLEKYHFTEGVLDVIRLLYNHSYDE